MCPPARPRGGVSIPKYIYASRIMHEDLTMDVPLTGRHGRAHRHRPYQSPSNRTVCHYRITLYIRSSTPNARCAHTPSYCTFDSQRQLHGVPLPRSGYTFGSAGLASATQPTLGNDASKEATPLGGCTFSITLLFNLLSPHTYRGRKCIAHSRPHYLK